MLDCTVHCGQIVMERTAALARPVEESFIPVVHPALTGRSLRYTLQQRGAPVLSASAVRVFVALLMLPTSS